MAKTKLTDVEFEAVRGITLRSGEADPEAGGAPMPAVIVDIDFEAYGVLKFALDADRAADLAAGLIGKTKEAVAEYMKRHKES